MTSDPRSTSIREMTEQDCSAISNAFSDQGWNKPQALYIRRGYLPDGKGISFHAKFLEYGRNATVDDDLTIGFIKHLDLK